MTAFGKDSEGRRPPLHIDSRLEAAPTMGLDIRNDLFMDSRQLRAGMT